MPLWLNLIEPPESCYPLLEALILEGGGFESVKPVPVSALSYWVVNGGKEGGTLLDAMSIESLKQMDIVVTCQGGDYTKEIFPKLRATGWDGHWIDAASALRMLKKSDTASMLTSVSAISFRFSGSVRRCQRVATRRAGQS